MSISFASNETLGCNPGVPNNDLLMINEPRTRRESSASVRSSLSTHTIIEGNPNGDFSNKEIQKRIKRARTERLNVRISRWALFWAFLCGPKKAAQMIRNRTTIEEPDDESDRNTAFDHKQSPFVKTLEVLSRSDGVKAIPGRCAFDTGSYLGNIVSLKFVLSLGYKESEFKPLDIREESGLSSSGDKIYPRGAVLLSWYHGYSPQFSGMRFLVVEDYHFDLLIGAESIYRHNMMSPITFTQLKQKSGVTTVSKTRDVDLENLEKELKDRKDQRDKHGQKKKKALEKDPSDHSHDAKYGKYKRLVKIKELQILEHKLKKDLKRQPGHEGNQELLKQTQAKLNAEEAPPNTAKITDSGTTKSMEKGSSLSPKTPGIEINIQAPSRANTVLSQISKSATRSLRK